MVVWIFVSFLHLDVFVAFEVTDVHIGVSCIILGELWVTHVSFMVLFRGHFHGFSFRGRDPALPIPCGTPVLRLVSGEHHALVVWRSKMSKFVSFGWFFV